MIEEIKDNRLFDDEKYYLPLISAIHQYVNDEIERNKLIEVLTMNMPADEIYEKVMNSGIYEQGLEQGEFNMALKIKRSLGIEEAIRLSNFSRKELEEEILER